MPSRQRTGGFAAGDRSAVAAAQVLRSRAGGPVNAVVVLGSGWDTAAEALGHPFDELPATDLPGFAPQTAPGHRGLLRLVDLAGSCVLVCLGRTHLFEGHGPAPVAAAVRTSAAAGARVAVLTNASGGLRPDWPPGTGALIREHLNWTGASPLSGPAFVDLTDAWSTRLRSAARAADPSLVEGVYAGMRGPSVQTLAETRMLRTVGADLVGMSTVLEAIAARAAGLELLGLAAVTTAEGTGEALDPEEVVAVAHDTARRVAPVIPAVLRYALTGPAPDGGRIRRQQS